jgi:hypothetical protein
MMKLHILRVIEIKRNEFFKKKMNKKDFVEYILSLCTLHNENAWHPLMTTCKLVYNSIYVQACIRMHKVIQLLQNETEEIVFDKYGKQSYCGVFLDFYLSRWMKFVETNEYGYDYFYVVLYDDVVFKKINYMFAYPVIYVNIAKNPGPFFCEKTLPWGALQKFIIYDEIKYLKSY